MQQKIYTLIIENRVESYFNLQSLVDNNPNIPYMKAYRALLKFNSYTRDNYSIHISTAKYKTNRGNKK